MMRKIVYIIGFLVCVSCSESAKKSQDNLAPRLEEYRIESDKFSDTDDKDILQKNKDLDWKGLTSTLDNVNFDAEITEKLQANYEAQLLAVKHPEFAEAIKEQLADSKKFAVSLSDSIQNITIEDVQFLGNMNTENDSISTQKIAYTTLINSKYTQKDSALVVIKRALIKIDNTVRVNTSFVFERLDD